VKKKDTPNVVYRTTIQRNDETVSTTEWCQLSRTKLQLHSSKNLASCPSIISFPEQRRTFSEDLQSCENLPYASSLSLDPMRVKIRRDTSLKKSVLMNNELGYLGTW
jgi:hypothetical protein